MSAAWQAPPTVMVNGVFKGGGAKGIAYVGALEVMETNGFRFRAVSGSSAGAITAALIAAGYGASDLRALLPEVLGQLDSPWRAVLTFHRRALLRSEPLERWLDNALSNRVGTSESVTFAELFSRTGIGLYVVAMDSARGQPIVFSDQLTPHMPVAAAVTASAAIPVAFPAYPVAAGGETVRLIDGGVWANYPHFVFLDDEFRRAHRLAGGADVPTVGFTLEDAADPVDRPSVVSPIGSARTSFTDAGSAARRLGPLGALMSSPWVKVLAIATPLLAGLAMIIAAWWLASDQWSALDGLPPVLQPVAMVVLVLGLSVASLVLAVSLFLTVRFSRALLDEGLSGVSSAMGVGPSVPYWLGGVSGRPGIDRHAVIRIPVPKNLGTLSFRAKPAAIEAAITAGRVAATNAVRGRRRSVPTSPTSEPGIPAVGRREYIEALGLSLFFGMFKAAVFGFVAVLAVRQASERRIFLILPLIAIGIGAAWSIRTYAKRRHARATGERPSMRLLGVWWNLAIAAVMFGAAALFGSMQQSESTQIVLATDGERELRGVLFRDDVPLLRLLRAGELVGVVASNEIENGQRVVTVSYTAASVGPTDCAPIPAEIAYPVRRILGAQYAVDDSFTVPFEPDSCTILWTEQGGRPEIGDGLYLALILLAAATVGLNALVAAVVVSIERLRRRVRRTAAQV